MSAPVLIFGAHGGIGEALARRLAAQQVPLVLTGQAEDTVAPIADELRARYQICDVREDGQIETAVAVAADGGGLAGLAYCVGSILLRPLKATKAADFLDAFRLNTLGPALAIKAAQPALQAASGSVVMFSTVAVAQGFANHAAIAAAKGGVEGLTRALAAELAPKVRVNAIAPSLTDTAMAAPVTGNAAMAKGIAALHAIPRLGLADDMAAVAAFLLGPDSGWVTGQVIGVDGGRSTLRTKG